MRPPSTVIHLLCVPGRHSVCGPLPASASTRPSTWVSSPRITSGVPPAGRWLTPGAMYRRRPGRAGASKASMPAAMASAPAGAST